MGSREAQRRIISTVQRVESEPRAYTPPRRMPRLSSGGQACITGSITARSGTTPGTGTVVLQDVVSGDFATGATISVQSFAGTAIPSGKFGWVQDGWIISVEC